MSNLGIEGLRKYALKIANTVEYTVVTAHIDLLESLCDSRILEDKNAMLVSIHKAKDYARACELYLMSKNKEIKND